MENATGSHLSPSRPEKAAGLSYQELDIFKAYARSPYLSIKHSSYFQVYTDLFERYRGLPIVFVEVGVLNGGSLFMWREYFGSAARIIGVDLNPGARRWEADGFEIHIGSQSDPEFWKQFFAEVGPVDILLDDGGHTFEQQIVTVSGSLDNIRDGGLLVVEDTHTSYFKDFGYPSRYSFMEWVKFSLDGLNGRFPQVHGVSTRFREMVYALTVFESIVALRIDRQRCFTPAPTSNGGESFNAQDFRMQDTASKVFRKLTADKRYKRTLAKLRVDSYLKKLKSFFV